MKFNDLVFLAEMDYRNISGDVSQNVRDASLGDQPEIDTNPVSTAKQGGWDFEKELDTPQGLFVVRFNASYGKEAVDHDPGFSDRYSAKDIYAMVPTDIESYEVVELDDNANEIPVTGELEQKLLNQVWVNFVQDPDNYREVSSSREDY